MWYGTGGEPIEDSEAEPKEGRTGASESEEETGSASAWASRESRRDRLIKSSSVRRAGREETVEEARVNSGRLVKDSE